MQSAKKSDCAICTPDLISTSLKIDMQFFAEKDIEKQDSNSLKRAMKKYQVRIEEHKNKINSPEKYIDDWDRYDERKKQGLKKTLAKGNKQL